uniref:Autophagy-related protein 9 n=1 Tax=Globodera pallida TaxID=36090 RepID=A0A183CES0_GLOPA
MRRQPLWLPPELVYELTLFLRSWGRIHLLSTSAVLFRVLTFGKAKNRLQVFSIKARERSYRHRNVGPTGVRPLLPRIHSVELPPIISNFPHYAQNLELGGTGFQAILMLDPTRFPPNINFDHHFRWHFCNQLNGFLTTHWGGGIMTCDALHIETEDYDLCSIKAAYDEDDTLLDHLRNCLGDIARYCPIEEEEEEQEGPQSFNGGAPEQNGRSMLGTGLCQKVSKGQKRDRDGNMCESAFPQVPKELGVSFKCEKDAEMSSTREGLARWDHVGDVDQFFSYIYEYYQQKGIRCIAFRYVFSLFRFAFVVFFSTFLLQCVDYGVIFNTRNTTLNGTPLPEKKGIQDVLIPQCHRHLNFLVKIALFLAFLFWVGHFMRICCRLIQFCEIKRFFATQLQIYDNDLQNLSWNDVVHSLCRAQERIHLIVSRDSINSLDIYQRILRHRNYFVALVYKLILPPQIGLPLVGNVHYLSSGLRFNLEWLLFWGPWSPWKSSYALKDEFKERDNLERIAQHMRMTIVVMSVVNLVFMPFVAVYQVLSSFFSYSEHFQRDPHILGMRKYSNYGREKLRHFNEMDSELDARLNRSYEFAVRYTDQFVSPLAKIIAKNVAFVAAAFFVVLCALTAYDEDTLKIEHITTLITVTGAIVLACRVFIPNEHLVFCQQLLMRQIVANIHYAPKSWLNKAHSTEICSEFTQIFRLKAELLVEELLSPILTPFILYFRIRPRVMEIIEFFHKYTVHVDGLGDVCALAQMDICRDGDARLASINCSVIVGDCSNNLKHRQKSSSGKVELSLLNFAAQHPDWTPSKECSEFIGNVKALVAQEISVGAHEIGDANGAETSLLDAQTLALLQASAYASLHQMEKKIDF